MLLKKIAPDELKEWDINYTKAIRKIERKLIKGQNAHIYCFMRYDLENIINYLRFVNTKMTIDWHCIDWYWCKCTGVFIRVIDINSPFWEDD